MLNKVQSAVAGGENIVVSVWRAWEEEERSWSCVEAGKDIWDVSLDILVFEQSAFAEDVGGDVSCGEKTGEGEGGAGGEEECDGRRIGVEDRVLVVWIVGCGLGKWFGETFQRSADFYGCCRPLPHS